MFSNNIKYLRDRLGMSQQGLADTIGVKRSTIGAWEEKRNKCGIDMLIKLSNCFGILVDMLIKVEIQKIATDEMIKIIRTSVRNYKVGDLKNYDYQDYNYKKLPKLITA